MSRDYYKSGVQYVKKDNEGGADLETLTLRSGLDITAGGIDLNGGSETGVAAGATIAINLRSGNIVTAALVTAAGATSAITLNNSTITATSKVFANIVNYAGTQGIPMLHIDGIAVGTVDLVIQNIHATLALDGAITINFFVLDS